MPQMMLVMLIQEKRKSVREREAGQEERELSTSEFIRNRSEQGYIGIVIQKKEQAEKTRPSSCTQREKMKSRIQIPNVQPALDSAHLLSTVYTNEFSRSHKNNVIVKFSDNIAILGLLHMDASPIVLFLRYKKICTVPSYTKQVSNEQTFFH